MMKNLSYLGAVILAVAFLSFGELYPQAGYWKVTSYTTMLGATNVVEYQHWTDDNQIICLNYGANNRVTLSYDAWLTSPYLPGKVFVGPLKYNGGITENRMVLATETDEFSQFPPTVITYAKMSDEEAEAFEKDLATMLSSQAKMEYTPSAKAAHSPDYIKSQIQYYQNKIDDVDRSIERCENSYDKSLSNQMLLNQLKSSRHTYMEYKREWEEKLYK